MKTLPLAEVKAKLSGLIDQVATRDEEIIITRKGRSVAVLVSADEFDSWKETSVIRQDLTLMKEIRSGLRALRRRKSKLYTLDELLD